MFDSNTTMKTVREDPDLYRLLKKGVFNTADTAAFDSLTIEEYFKKYCHADGNLSPLIVNTLKNLASNRQKFEHSLPHSRFFFYPGRADKPTFILLPGGGYSGVSLLNEGFCIATVLNIMGFNVEILEYSTGHEAVFPNPLEDLATMITYLGDHANEFNFDSQNYYLAGFSAGGHLAGLFCTDNIGYENYGLNKPCGLILAYPVVTMKEHAHPGSKTNILGPNINDRTMIHKISVEEHVHSLWPKTYILEFDHDEIVPVENTELLIESFKKNNVPYQLNLVEGKEHGVGIGDFTSAKGWLFDAIEYLLK